MLILYIFHLLLVKITSLTNYHAFNASIQIKAIVGGAVGVTILIPEKGGGLDFNSKGLGIGVSGDVSFGVGTPVVGGSYGYTVGTSYWLSLRNKKHLNL